MFRSFPLLILLPLAFSCSSAPSVFDSAPMLHYDAETRSYRFHDKQWFWPEGWASGPTVQTGYLGQTLFYRMAMGSGHLDIVDLTTGETVRQIRISGKEYRYPGWGSFYSRDGSVWALTHFQYLARYDLKTGTQVRFLDPPQTLPDGQAVNLTNLVVDRRGRLYTEAFTVEGQQIRTRLVSLDDEGQFQILSEVYDGRGTFLTYDADRDVIYYVMNPATVMAYDPKSGQSARVFEGPKDFRIEAAVGSEAGLFLNISTPNPNPLSALPSFRWVLLGPDGKIREVPELPHWVLESTQYLIPLTPDQARLFEAAPSRPDREETPRDESR